MPREINFELDENDMKKVKEYLKQLRLPDEDYRAELLKLLVCLDKHGFTTKFYHVKENENICEINGKRTSYHLERNYQKRFNIALKHLAEGNAFIYIIGEHKFCFVIPPNDMREIAENCTLKRGGTQRHFHIDLSDRVLKGSEGYRKDIRKYYRNFDCFL